MQLESYTTNRNEPVHELLKSIKILNIYQINISSKTLLMHQISTKTAPSVFLSKFKKPSHLYSK